MIDIKYLIIVDSKSKKDNHKLIDMLRSCDIDFMTGYYKERGYNNKMQGCCWYALPRRINFGKISLYHLIECPYKAMSTDCLEFECNCADVDLPMIEHIWDGIKACLKRNDI